MSKSASRTKRNDERFAVEYQPSDERIAGLREAIELADRYMHAGGLGLAIFRDCLVTRLRTLEKK